MNLYLHDHLTFKTRQVQPSRDPVFEYVDTQAPSQSSVCLNSVQVCNVQPPTGLAALPGDAASASANRAAVRRQRQRERRRLGKHNIGTASVDNIRSNVEIQCDGNAENGATCESAGTSQMPFCTQSPFLGSLQGSHAPGVARTSGQSKTALDSNDTGMKKRIDATVKSLGASSKRFLWNKWTKLQQEAHVQQLVWQSARCMDSPFTAVIDAPDRPEAILWSMLQQILNGAGVEDSKGSASALRDLLSKDRQEGMLLTDASRDAMSAFIETDRHVQSRLKLIGLLESLTSDGSSSLDLAAAEAIVQDSRIGSTVLENKVRVLLGLPKIVTQCSDATQVLRESASSSAQVADEPWKRDASVHGPRRRVDKFDSRAIHHNGLLVKVKNTFLHVAGSDLDSLSCSSSQRSSSLPSRRSSSTSSRRLRF